MPSTLNPEHKLYRVSIEYEVDGFFWGDPEDFQTRKNEIAREMWDDDFEFYQASVSAVEVKDTEGAGYCDGGYLTYNTESEDISVNQILDFIKNEKEAALKQVEFLKKQTDLFGEEA